MRTSAAVLALLAGLFLTLPADAFVSSSRSSISPTNDVQTHANAVSSSATSSRLGSPMSSPRSTSTLPLLSAASPNGATPEEEEEMKELIVSLSNEPTDESRRQRMQTVITEGLSKSDDDAAMFCILFQQSLEAVGNEVQAAARELAMKKYKEKASSPSFDPEKSVGEQVAEEETAIRIENVNESGGKIKSPEEMQLWALVDMMVQSKTMIKKAAGELGTKGEFQ